MDILLTNDDGISSEGIYTIYKELGKIGNVTIVAPDSERSSISHAITLAQPIYCKKVFKSGEFYGYGISGTPADCVKFAMKVVFKKKPDLVVSGINIGRNDGCSVHYSGTVAGAREGALCGIKSIALSLATFTKPNFKEAAKYGIKLIKKLISIKSPRGTFYNINIPAKSFGQIKGFKITKQGLNPIHGEFQKRTAPNLKDYYWMDGQLPKIEINDQSDTFFLDNNFATVTPVLCDTTDDEHYNQMLIEVK